MRVCVGWSLEEWRNGLFSEFLTIYLMGLDNSKNHSEVNHAKAQLSVCHELVVLIVRNLCGSKDICVCVCVLVCRHMWTSVGFVGRHWHGGKTNICITILHEGRQLYQLWGRSGNQTSPNLWEGLSQSRHLKFVEDTLEGLSDVTRALCFSFLPPTISVRE